MNTTFEDTVENFAEQLAASLEDGADEQAAEALVNVAKTLVLQAFGPMHEELQKTLLENELQIKELQQQLQQKKSAEPVGDKVKTVELTPLLELLTKYAGKTTQPTACNLFTAAYRKQHGKMPDAGVWAKEDQAPWKELHKQFLAAMNLSGKRTKATVAPVATVAAVAVPVTEELSDDDKKCKAVNAYHIFCRGKPFGTANEAWKGMTPAQKAPYEKKLALIKAWRKANPSAMKA